MEAPTRISSATPESDAFWLATRILSMPRNPTQAIAVFTGLGEDSRVHHAITRWQTGEFKNLLVTGLNQKEKTAKRFTLEALVGDPFFLGHEKGVHTQVDAAHTPAQCEWLLAHVRMLKIDSLTLVAPSYHLPRAFLTLLKQLNRAEMRVVLVPDPVPAPPSAITPETGKSQSEMLAAEFARIAVYQAKGDVATSEELDIYLEWLYRKPRA